jgi:dienelactone hydrolase
MSCPACFQGKERTDAEPTGTVSKVYGRDTYTAEPPSGAQPKGIVVIIPDAFGWEFKNNRLLADEYARQGQFRVYLPDFMDGEYDPL